MSQPLLHKTDSFHPPMLHIQSIFCCYEWMEIYSPGHYQLFQCNLYLGHKLCMFDICLGLLMNFLNWYTGNLSNLPAFKENLTWPFWWYKRMRIEYLGHYCNVCYNEPIYFLSFYYLNQLLWHTMVLFHCCLVHNHYVFYHHMWMEIHNPQLHHLHYQMFCLGLQPYIWSIHLNKWRKIDLFSQKLLSIITL